MTFSDEWENFLERIGKGDSGDAELQESSTSALELRFWASYRGQTLARTGFADFFSCEVLLLILNMENMRTFMVYLLLLVLIAFPVFGAVRGMMYYRRALMLQCYLERRSLDGKYSNS